MVSLLFGCCSAAVHIKQFLNYLSLLVITNHITADITAPSLYIIIFYSDIILISDYWSSEGN